VLGESVTEIAFALGSIVTCAAAAYSVFATDVAVTLTTEGLGTVDGAVYTPALLIVPAVALQVIFLFDVPATAAVNCKVFDVMTLALAGEIVTTTLFVVVASLLPLPPHPPVIRIARKHANADARASFILRIRFVAFVQFTEEVPRWLLFRPAHAPGACHRKRCPSSSV
jgi:hypothetical protein